jgi:MFS family permease
MIFSFTLFLSAALMFALQPMVGKMLLPVVGGTPAGWIVAMAFFQVALLAGYFLAHLLSRFTPRTQVLLYILCLGIGTFFLPVTLGKFTALLSPSPRPFEVFLLLSAAVAIPFMALSATASTLQRLFTTTGHTSAEDPYFLYAASNLGSFAGLLLYPFYIESRSTLTMQAQGWFLGYILLIVMAVVCLALSGKETPVRKPATEPLFAVGWKRWLEWIGLAMVPSGLLLAVTMHITTDIFSVPLLWVLPLGIYLLTFVAAFSKRQIINYHWLLNIQPVAAAIAIALTLMVTDSFAMSWYSMGVHLTAFGVVALMCHMRLARGRPVDSRRLTEFYLMISLGGALGGVLVAFLAPLLFDRLVEYPLLMAASGLCNPNIRSRFSRPHAFAIIPAGSG